MQIDWFTLLAEVVNFLILAYLLKRFLYNPILGIADRREREIAQQYAEAEAREREAEQQAQAYEQERQKMADQREEMLEEARQAAQEERRRMMDEIRREVKVERREWRRQIEQQREAFRQALQRRASAEVYAVASRVIADLAGADLQEQVVGRFLTQLRRISDADADAVRRELDDGGIEIISAFPLQERWRRDIVRALREVLDVGEPTLTFSEDGELICGISMRIDGHKITWNVQSYLDQLQESVESVLHDEITEEAEAAQQAKMTHG